MMSDQMSTIVSYLQKLELFLEEYYVVGVEETHSY